ncbi:hypothetical protein EDB81DRAFT_697246 [Dactylonectria macrodidyma]|uniref:Fumarylacetoacetase-like C-terminal domain-containing protein n=1 Tax=Dactylonectria macrodidyma TaxID=307937 RepID=A0A9P9E1Q7_9HYPO|nr:hypothetical protein EDB81DRAFT_697246 [Dactylonectria macrodidyma]
MAWSRLVKFFDEDDHLRLGDALVDSAEDLAAQLQAGELTARELVGPDLFSAKPTDRVFRVQRLVGPLGPEDVPMLRCVGLNYAKHIKETGRAPPPYPSIFTKPSRSVTGWASDVPIPKIAQDDQLDYEGELAIVIGKEGKDISLANALEYVAGYTVANDVSARTWQRDPNFAGSVPQWCFSKGFDCFAPMGPVLVSPSVLGAADNLLLQTRVNGQVRQEASTSDLVFGVRRIIEFVSQGTTLEKGSVILTGTPGGVGLGMKPPTWLADGDVVEVSISGIGTVCNKMVFL